MKNTNTNTNYDYRVLAKGKVVTTDKLNGHDLVIGTSGASKSTGYVIPNILCSNGSIVVADTKSSMYKKLAPILKKKGFRVKVIDFINPLKSDYYNPIAYIGRRKDGSYCQQDIMSMANALVPLANPVDKFWVESARSIVACSIAYVLEALEKKDMSEVIKVIKEIASSVDYKNNDYCIHFLEDWADDYPDSYVVSKYKSFKGILSAERTFGSIVQFALSAIDSFDFDEIKHMFCGDKSFDFKSLGRRKTALFLNISDTDRALDTLVSLLYTQLFQKLCAEADSNPDGALKIPVRIFLDDFAANAVIQDFDKLISVIRSRKISVSIIVQSLSQLETIYTPAKATTIITNCDHIVFMGGTDLKTADYISTRMQLSPETVLETSNDSVLILTRGQKGEILPKIHYDSYDPKMDIIEQLG